MSGQKLGRAGVFFVASMTLAVSAAPIEQRPGDPGGLQCGAVYTPSWALSEHVPFAQTQVKACDSALSNSSSDATLRAALAQIGTAIAENWDAWHGANAWLPMPGDVNGDARRSEITAVRNEVLSARNQLRLLERLAQQLLKVSGDANLTPGQKALIANVIKRPGAKACATNDGFIWVWFPGGLGTLPGGLPDGGSEQVYTPDPILAETARSRDLLSVELSMLGGAGSPRMSCPAQ